MRVFTFHTRSPERTHVVAGLLSGLCVTAAACAASEGAAQPSLGHYQPILDRMPFGTQQPNVSEAPVDPAAAKNEEQVKAEQQKLAQQISMSAVNITADGRTAIGFTDLSEKPPINYYLLVGASAGGWTVLCANYDEETATLEKNEISVTLKLGKGLVDPASAPKPPAPPRTLSAPRPWGARPPAPTLRTAGPLQDPGPSEAAVSYKELLKARQQQEEHARQAAAQKPQEPPAKIVREATANEFKRREDEASVTTAEAAPAPDVKPAQHMRSINEGNVE